MSGSTDVVVGSTGVVADSADVVGCLTGVLADFVDVGTDSAGVVAGPVGVFGLESALDVSVGATDGAGGVDITDEVGELSG